MKFDPNAWKNKPLDKMTPAERSWIRMEAAQELSKNTPSFGQQTAEQRLRANIIQRQLDVIDALESPQPKATNESDLFAGADD